MTANGFDEAALRYLLSHAIEPEVATSVGVTQVGESLHYPYSTNGSTYVRRRPLGSDKTFQPEGRPLAVWWPQGKPETAEAVLVCEGEGDALAALSALDEARRLVSVVAAIPGTGFPVGRLVEELRSVGAKEAFLAFDADDAGSRATDRACMALLGARIAPIVVELPQGKDLADCLAAQEDGEDWLANALADAEAASDTDSGFFSFPSTPGGETNEKKVEDVSFGSTEPFAAPMSEKLAGVPSEPNWKWEGYLSPGALTLLAGRPKVGKTTLLFPLIAALEQGRSFLDRPTIATRVLMLSEEREQTLAEKRELYLNGADPLLLMRHEQGQRTWPEVIEQARAYCAEHEIGVLVIDTWDKWTGLRGDDESKAGAVIEALEPLMLAAGDGLAVLIVAHQRKAAGKHGEAVRGSNAITGGVDVIVELERAPEELGRRMRVLRAESRFTATPEELVGELTEEGGYIAQGELEQVQREVDGKSIARLVEAAPGSTTDQLAEALDMAPATMSRKLKDALDDNRITRQGAGRRGDPYRWHPIGEEGER